MERNLLQIKLAELWTEVEAKLHMMMVVQGLGDDMKKAVVLDELRASVRLKVIGDQLDVIKG